MMATKMIYTILLVVCCVTTSIFGQRPPYAGSRPTGNKNRLITTVAPNNSTAASAAANVPLDNRFGASDASVQTTTQRLPHLALGDAQLVNLLNQRPIEQRPFWLINSDAIEAQKNGGIRPNNNVPVPTSGFISSSNRPSSNLPLPSQNASENTILTTRFGEVSAPTNSQNQNVISQQEIVYPINQYIILGPVAPTNNNQQRLPFAPVNNQQNLPIAQQTQTRFQARPAPVAIAQANFFNDRNEYEDDHDDDYFH